MKFLSCIRKEDECNGNNNKQYFLWSLGNKNCIQKISKRFTEAKSIMKEETPFSSHAVETGALTIVHYNFSSRFVHSLAQRERSSDGFNVVLFGVFLII